jgi:hypothetical protein
LLCRRSRSGLLHDRNGGGTTGTVRCQAFLEQALELADPRILLADLLLELDLAIRHRLQVVGRCLRVSQQRNSD